MRSSRFVVAFCAPLTAVLAFPLAAPLAAQPEHPNHRRGLDTPTAYRYEQLDAVNLFNGNLNVTIPIAEIHVGGNLTVPIGLHYNSMIWGFETGPPASEPPHALTLSAKVDPFQNAGVGWLVTLGKLYPPWTPPHNDGPGWLLVEPDGTRRFFSTQLHPGHPANPDANVFYTTDGSYLRLKLSGGRWHLESPNGLVREFNTFDGNLLKVRDRSGNELNVDYTTPNRWALSDNALPTPRTHTIDFHAASGGVPQRLSQIKLAGFGGTSTIYDFIYDVIWIPRHYNHTSHGAPGGLPLHVNVALLSQIILPAGAGSYGMQYYLDNGWSAELTNPSGVLRRLDLPTRGRFEWDYYGWEIARGGAPFPETWHHISDGVRSKYIYSAAGELDGQWSYASGLGANRPDGSSPADPNREKRTQVTDPLGNVTLHYFTSFPDAWLHGLPFTDQVSDGTRYLSRQSFRGAISLANLKRTEWNRFVSDHLNDKSNQRLEASRTVFEDDVVDSVARWSGVLYSDFNGLGRYRTAATSGNFDSGNVRTSHVAYTRDSQDAHDSGTYPGAFSMWPSALAWVIDTFEEQWDLEGGATAKKTFDVNPATGLVRRARIHTASDGTVSSTDVIVVNDYDARGNLAFERFYGGDTQTVGTGSDLETLALPASPTYQLAHTTLWGTRATTAYVSSDPTVSSFKTLDCGDDPATGGFDPGIDASTGLPSKCRDTSRIATSYEYDALGRLVWEKPDPGHDGWTEYVHTPASVFGLANVTVRRWPNGGGAPPANPLAQTAAVYDDFGRLFEEQQTMADGTTSTSRTLYNAMGWRTSVSEQGNTAKKTEFLSYDAFGRPGTIRPPDGPNHDVTFTYAGVRSVSRSVKVATSVGPEATTTVTSFNDRQGRLYRVREEADYDLPGTPRNTTTTYGYDVGNRLVAVSHQNFPGTQTQTRKFSYDQRGFLLSEQHPEKGASNPTVFYSSYDARGHVGRKQDGPFDISFIYDAAERLFTVHEAGVLTDSCRGLNGRRCLKTFTYGISNLATLRTNGRLEQASRFNHVGAGYNLTVEVVESYTYAGRQGRVSRRNTAYNNGGSPGTESWRQTYTYDALGNVEGLGYPDCTWAGCPSSARTVTNVRTHGWLTYIPGFATTISYHSNGLYDQIAHTNGVVDKQTNDLDGMRRPRELSAKATGSDLWRSGVYAYDGAGNVKGMGNSYFLYDRVSRVVDGHVYDGPTGGGLLRYQTYSYDPFGNLKSIGGDPWAAGRATPTSVTSNRLTGSSYDSAGNLTGWNGSACGSTLPSNPCYEYDAFGMMTRYSTGNPGQDWRYIYTADDERFWALAGPGISGGSVWTLRDLDGKVLREYEPNAQAAWSRFRDYVYRDGQLLASSFLGEGVRHVSLDHLGTPRLTTGTNGPAGSLWTGTSAGCVPVPGDYNGDGRSELALKCEFLWHFYRDDGTYLKSIWTGAPGSHLAVPADYDGDGDDDIVTFDNGAWHFYDYGTGAYHGVFTGSDPGCKPAPADYDGDGNADFAIQCAYVWHFYRDDGSYLKGLWTGAPASHIPVPADYDGDGRAEVVAFDGGAWHFYDYVTGAYHGVFTGVNGTPRPVPMDYDGDGTSDFTVHADGAWHFFNDNGSYLQGISTGAVTGDVPLAVDFTVGRAGEPLVFRGGTWLFFSLGGLPVSYHVYFPFGEEIFPPSEEASDWLKDAERKKFTGHERDFANPTAVADNLDYMHARYYNPQVGRFLSTDPADSSKPGAPQSWNLYSYVANNPLKYIDPNGAERAAVMQDVLVSQLVSGEISQREYIETYTRPGPAAYLALGIAGFMAIGPSIPMIAALGETALLTPEVHLTAAAIIGAYAEQPATAAMTRLITQLDSAPQAGRALSAAAGEGADALAAAARQGGKFFEAKLPTAMITALERAGLVTITRTMMGGKVALEVRIAADAMKELSKRFMEVDPSIVNRNHVP